MSNRHKPSHLLFMSGMAAFWGVIAFSGVASNPRFESIHVLDVIRLMTAGAGLAVAVVAMVMFFARRSEEKRAGAKSGEAAN